MAKGADTKLLVVVLVGGAAYLLLRPKFAEAGAGNPTAGPLPAVAPGGLSNPANRTGVILSSAAAVGGAVIPAIIGATAGGAGAVAAGAGSVVASSATGGAAVAAGTSGLALATAIAIPATAAFLSWEIALNGWFRGGKEGVYVNPARDDFFNFFIVQSSYNLPAPWNPTAIGAIPRANFTGDVQTVRYNAFLEVMRGKHVPDDQIHLLITAIYAAKTPDEFAAAARAVSDAMVKYGSV